MFFVVVIIAAAIKKKNCSYRNSCGIRLHAGNLEHSLHMFFFSFLCSAIPNIDVGIVKMLIHVCFRDLLQPGVY